MVRDFIIEHIKNAFQHGAATETSFEITRNAIKITDNGKYFNPKTLLAGDFKSGGTLAIRQLVKPVASRIIVTSEHSAGFNITTLGLLEEPADIEIISNCWFKLDYDDLYSPEIDLNISETCDEIFILLPEYPELSMVFTKGWREKNIRIKGLNKHVTFILKGVSATFIDLIAENHPYAKIIIL